MRTMLFVPGSRPAMFPKAAASEADAVCLDLEDSVLPDEKATARANVIRGLNEIDFGHRLRMIPKVASAADIAFVDDILTRIEQAQGSQRRVGIEAQIESAAGFLYVREIASASERLESLIFGPGDFAASMQMPATGIGEMDAHDAVYPGHRYHAVMLTIVAAARANGLRCMDGPYAGYTDTAGLVRACEIAIALGFDGKQCIHPGQLATVNAAFSPSDEEVARASALVKAYEAAISEGRGAASFQGRMIDAASLRMAQVIIRRHELAAR